jgi:hypothetical protein
MHMSHSEKRKPDVCRPVVRLLLAVCISRFNDLMTSKIDDFLQIWNDLVFQIPPTSIALAAYLKSPSNPISRLVKIESEKWDHRHTIDVMREAINLQPIENILVGLLTSICGLLFFPSGKNEINFMILAVKEIEWISSRSHELFPHSKVFRISSTLIQ